MTPAMNSHEMMQSVGDATEILGQEVLLWRGLFRRRHLRDAFNADSIAVRVRAAEDVRLAIHELAFGMWQLLALWNGNEIRPPENLRLRIELMGIGRASYPAANPTGGWVKEGFAEFVWLWVTDPAQAKRRAPKLLDWWETNFLPAMPEFTAAIEKLQQQVTRYRTQENRVPAGGQLADSDIPKTIAKQGQAKMETPETNTTIWNSSLTSLMTRAIAPVRRQGAMTRNILLLSVGVVIGGLIRPWIEPDGRWDVKHVVLETNFNGRPKQEAVYRINERTGETFVLQGSVWVKMNVVAQ